MDKDRMVAKEQVKNLPTGEKLKHYWHYYKTHFFITLLVLVIIGVFVFQKVTHVEPDLMIAMYTEEYIADEAESAAEKKLADLMKSKDKEAIINLSITTIPPERELEQQLNGTDQASVAYTKLEGQLAAGTTFAFVFDEESYNRLMSSENRQEIIYNEFSGEIGENGKAALGIKSDRKYYYVTRIIYETEKGDEEAEKNQKFAIKTYEKLKSLD